MTYSVDKCYFLILKLNLFDMRRCVKPQTKLRWITFRCGKRKEHSSFHQSNANFNIHTESILESISSQIFIKIPILWGMSLHFALWKVWMHCERYFLQISNRTWSFCELTTKFQAKCNISLSHLLDQVNLVDIVVKRKPIPLQLIAWITVLLSFSGLNPRWLQH